MLCGMRQAGGWSRQMQANAREAGPAGGPDPAATADPCPLSQASGVPHNK